MKCWLNIGPIRLLLALVLLALVLTGLALPVAGLAEVGVYSIDSWAVGGGGGTSTGGGFALAGTIGRTDAGSLGGGSLTLSGGFWGRSWLYSLHLPAIFQGSSTGP